MSQAKVTFKGQITIPKAVRLALDIRAGDSVVFQMGGDHVVMKPLRKKDLVDFYGAFPTDRIDVGIDSERKTARRKVAEKHVGADKT